MSGAREFESILGGKPRCVRDISADVVDFCLFFITLTLLATFRCDSVCITHASARLEPKIPRLTPPSNPLMT